MFNLQVSCISQVEKRGHISLVILSSSQASRLNVMEVSIVRSQADPILDRRSVRLMKLSICIRPRLISVLSGRLRVDRPISGVCFRCGRFFGSLARLSTAQARTGN